MLELIHILIACLCVWQCFIAFRVLQFQFAKFLLFSGIGLIHGIVPAIAPYSSMNAGYDEQIEAACFALCGTLALSLGWFICEIRTRTNNPQRASALHILKQATYQQKLEQLFLLSAVIGAIAWPGKIYAVGSTFSEYATEGRFVFRGSGNQLFAWLCSSLMNYAFLPGFLGFFLSKRHRSIGIAYALCYALFYFLVTSGTRSFPIGIAGSVLCGFVLHRPQSVSRLAFLGFSGGALIILAVGMLPLRWQMSHLSYSEMGQFLLSYETYEDMLVRDPLNYHEYLVEVIDLFPEEHDYVHAASYQRILFFFLPHSKFPTLKPRDPNQIVAELLFDTKDTQGWMHPPSLFGDSYINFYGWLGIGFLALEGFVLAWFARMIYLQPIWLLLLGPNLVHFSFIGLRGQPYTLAVYSISMLFYLAILMRTLNIPFLAGIRGAQPRPRFAPSRRRRMKTNPTLGTTRLRRVPARQLGKSKRWLL